MPNYVANIVTIVGSDDKVQEVVDFLKSDYGVFDFEKVLPCPEDLNIDSCSDGEDGMTWLVCQNKSGWLLSDTEKRIIERMAALPEDVRERKIALGRHYLMNLALYDATTWYDWHTKNWGTKWNAIEAEYWGDGRFTFDTAWSAPAPVLVALSEKFPDVAIDFVFADEDSGYNTGEGQLRGGDGDVNYPEGGSDEAWALYFETHEWARDEMHKDENGNWVWND